VYQVCNFYLFDFFGNTFFVADRIIFANPCKQTSYVRYAEEVGVEILTFDNEQELMKIKKAYSNAK
jgi:diaminopimelate decarboxylase